MCASVGSRFLVAVLPRALPARLAVGRRVSCWARLGQVSHGGGALARLVRSWRRLLPGMSVLLCPRSLGRLLRSGAAGVVRGTRWSKLFPSRGGFLCLRSAAGCGGAAPVVVYVGELLRVWCLVVGSLSPVISKTLGVGLFCE